MKIRPHHLLPLLLLGAMAACAPKPADHAAWVNPFIGTDGHGHTYPGAVYPNGMVQPGPDTRVHGWDACSGYHYSDTTVNGFSQTHLNGTGCADLGDVLIMPVTGAQDCDGAGSSAQQMPWSSAFSHGRETASPGYYSVYLDRYGITAELTATPRAALHRYTFPASDEAGFIVDLDYSIGGRGNEEMEIEALSDTEIAGRKKSVGWARDRYVNFYAKFSKPFTCTLLTDGDKARALLRFSTGEGERVMVKVGLSAVDIDGARNNVETEIPGWDFDSVRSAARGAWNAYLSKIDVETKDAESRTVFYTALYHTGLQPCLFSDVDGRYRGMDLEVRQGDASDPVYNVFSIWDTFRAYHPLMTVIDPDFNAALIRSLILKGRECGMFPMWELAGNDTGTMIGYHAVSLMADAWTKGCRDFDLEEAYRLGLRSAEYDPEGIVARPGILAALMPPAKEWKNRIGYVPCDRDCEAVAKGLEYAYDDWCISILADAAGDSEVARKYAEFARAYKWYFDPSTLFMRGRDSSGGWREPFNPRASDHRRDDYTEGTAWQWTWFVPHDVDGLVALFGGREAFTAKLDSLFTADSAIDGDNVSPDISGLIGQYAHGNEPSHHISHLYNYVGEPWRTQEIVDEVLYTLYSDGPDGLSGNEDCGQMSAWYILNAMGVYQVCPGEPVWSIGRPLFDRVTINLPGGKTFTVTARHNSRENKYVQSMTLNGRPLDAPFLAHDDLVSGGVLDLVMGPAPKK